MTDIIERLKDQSLQLARRSFDSVDAGLAANVADAAIDEIERLRDALETLLNCGNAVVGADASDPLAREAFDMYDEARKKARRALATVTSHISQPSEKIEPSAS